MIIDINERLTLLRRARRLARQVGRTQLRMAAQLVAVTEDEVRRQMLVLCDRHAAPADVEEATVLMPLLTELLLARREALRALELELLGPIEPRSFDLA